MNHKRIKIVQIAYRGPGLSVLLLDDKGRVWYAPKEGHWVQENLPMDPDMYESEELEEITF